MQQHPFVSQNSAQSRRPALDMVSRHPLAASRPARPVLMKASEQLLSRKRALDGLLNAPVSVSRPKHHSFKDTCWRIFRRSQLYARFIRRRLIRLLPDIAPHKMLYGSLVGGVAFGMISMATIEHYFGPGVFAQSSEISVAEDSVRPPEDVTDTAASDGYGSINDIFFEYFSEAAGKQYEDKVREMVKGYPIEEMLPYILEKDRLTASFLIGIAKKESNWGKRIPVLDGQDCFNYWGYRGVRRMMGSGGHTCFNSRKDAVDTVAVRLNKLVNSEKLNTPEKLVVWKCGYSCAGHSQESVRKWISDVDMYFSELNDLGDEE
jgi:hypothetical protein